MDKKKKKDINITIIGSGLLTKGMLILFLYCLIVFIACIGFNEYLNILAFSYLGLGLLSVLAGFEMLIINNTYRIRKLELQQKGEW